MRSLKNDGVRRYQCCTFYIDEIAGGRVSNGGVFGLGLVKKRQGAAPAPAYKHNSFVTPLDFGAADVCAKIKDDFLQDGRSIVARIATAGAQDVCPIFGGFSRNGQKLESRRRVHEDVQ